MSHIQNKAILGKYNDKHIFWAGHLRTLQSSGLTQAEYCRRHGVKAQRLIYWRQRLGSTLTPASSFIEGSASPSSSRKTPGPPSSDRSNLTFVQVRQPSSQPSDSPALQLTVGDKFQLQIGADFSPKTLKRLLLVLREVEAL